MIIKTFKKLSLVEILIAIVIMVIAFIPIMRVTSSTVKGTIKVDNNFLAVSLAKSYLAHAKMKAYYQTYDEIEDFHKGKSFEFIGSNAHEFFKNFMGDTSGITSTSAPELYNQIKKYEFSGSSDCEDPTNIGSVPLTVRVQWEEDDTKYIELKGVLTK